MFCKYLLNIGVTELNVIDARNGQVTFRISARPAFLNGVDINLNNEIFSLLDSKDEAVLSFKSNILVKKDKNTNEIFIKAGLDFDYTNLVKVDENSYVGDVKQNVFLALLLLHEFTDHDKSLSESPQVITGKTWICVNVNYGNSTATLDTQNESAAFIASHPGCVLYGGIDTSCAWGNHFCVATQIIHCK